MNTQTLVFDISAHGLGHLAQAAPLIRETKARYPTVNIFVRSEIGKLTVDNFLGFEALTSEAPPDVGLLMKAPHLPDLEQSYRQYLALHEDLENTLQVEAWKLGKLGADALISDVGYTGIAAAAKYGIPSFALCSLSWDEVFTQYFAHRIGADSIHAQILDCYMRADSFFVPDPRQTLSTLERPISVGVIGRDWGKADKSKLLLQSKAPVGKGIGLISFGGIAANVPVPVIPKRSDWIWIVDDSLIDRFGNRQKGDIRPLSRICDIDYLDIAASVDLVITKTGYSTFAECMIYGVPCLFLSRPDWPESAEIEQHMIDGGYGLPLTMQELTSGSWWDKAEHLLANPQPPVKPTGHIEVADYIFHDMGWA